MATKAIVKETAAASAAGVTTTARTTGTVMVMMVAGGSACLKSRRRHKSNNVGGDKGSDDHRDGRSDGHRDVNVRDDDSDAVMVAVNRRRADGGVGATTSAATRAAHVDPAAGKAGGLPVRDYLSGGYPQGSIKTTTTFTEALATSPARGVGR